MLEDQPIYPARRAFVVQLRATAEVARGQFCGRAEHIVSGQSQRFQTADELLQFITQVLTTTEESPTRPE